MSARVLGLSLVAVVAVAACGSGKAPSPAPSASAVVPVAVASADASSSASAAPSPSASSSASAQPRVREPVAVDPILEANAALVWQGGGKGGVTTVWVEPDGAAVAVKRKRAEATIATRHGLYGIRATVGRESTLDAVPLAGGAATTIVQAAIEGCPQGEPGAPCVSGMSDQQATVLLEGAIGAVVFATSNGMEWMPDAPHPEFIDDAVAFDVASGDRVPLAPFPGFDRLTKIANAKFLDAYGPEGGGCISSQDLPPNLDHADFAFDGAGKLHGHYWFTKPSNYMCGVGPGHRSVAIDVNDSALPDPMKPLMQAPKWLAPYLAKHPSIGVSPIPTELDVDKLVAVFEAPVPAPAKPKDDAPAP